MVSIVAFQAVDRGSIPCCRIIFYNKPKKKKERKKTCQKWDSNPRPHSWTRKPSATVIVEGSHPWVWRLRPLGHPDSGLRSSPLPFCSQTFKWRTILYVCADFSNRDSGVMVSIVAFQAVDRGSIPRCRNFLLFFFIKIAIQRDMKKKTSVRSGIWTHAHICGPECSRPL